MKAKKISLKSFTSSKIVRWWIVGLFFTGVNIPLLGILVHLLKLESWLATLIAAELGTALRFFINDRWVFGHPRPTAQRFWQYHVANASSFVIWWSSANILTYKFGIDPVLASIPATACSVGWSMMTNFLWIWGKKEKKPQVVELPAPASNQLPEKTSRNL